MPREIILTFDVKTGETVIEAKGYKGKTCAEATKFLKEALGECTEFKQKAEWYEVNLETVGSFNTKFCG